MTTRDNLIQYLTQRLKPDPKSQNWEFCVIVSSLQDCNPCSAQELLESINSKYQCDPPLFDYNGLYSKLQSLMKKDFVSYNPIRKKYNLKPEYFDMKHTHLPISNYNVFFFALTVVGLVFSIYKNYMVNTMFLIVLSGLFYLLGQHFGNEFNMRWRR